MKERKNLCASIVGWGVFLAGAFAFSSCVNDEEIDNGLQTTGQSIGFSASYGNSIWEPDQIRAAHDASGTTYSEYVRSFNSQQGESRGALIESKNANWGYKVGAYYTTPNKNAYDYFDENASGGLQVAASNVDKTTQYYWPPAGTMKFFAVAPIVDGLNVPRVATIATPTLTYTISDVVANQKDIMVAQETVADCSTYTGGPVGLQFQHLLSAVQFKVGEMNDVQINAITVSGVKGGTVTMTYDSTNGWAYSSTTNASYSPTPNTLSTFTRGTEITSGDNIMLVMPQTLGENAQVSVTYTASGVQDTKSVALNSTTSSNDDAWIAGRIHNYYLNINPGLSLSLTVEVQPWELITFTNEFSNTASVNVDEEDPTKDGRIKWTEGSYRSINLDGNNDNVNKVTLYDDISKPAEFKFTIAGPLGGTWKALLITKKGDPYAFTLDKTEGPVGDPAVVKISATKINNSKSENEVELRIIVDQGGQILPVNMLTKDRINYTIVQPIAVLGN